MTKLSDEESCWIGGGTDAKLPGGAIGEGIGTELRGERGGLPLLVMATVSGCKESCTGRVWTASEEACHSGASSLGPGSVAASLWVGST